MTLKKIEEYKQQLVSINNIPNSGRLIDVPDSNEKYDSGQYDRYKKLRKLALEVGASYISMERQKTANEGELTDGIHRALQTATMIEMCRISSGNFWIAVIAATIALLAMLAAWAAVLVNWLCSQ